MGLKKHGREEALLRRNSFSILIGFQIYSIFIYKMGKDNCDEV
jgi:hypothetical protein